jgi:hypothetical protein
MRATDSCYEIGDVCPVFLVDFAFRAAVKLKTGKAVPGTLINVSISSIDEMRLSLELTDILKK